MNSLVYYCQLMRLWVMGVLMYGTPVKVSLGCMLNFTCKPWICGVRVRVRSRKFKVVPPTLSVNFMPGWNWLNKNRRLSSLMSSPHQTQTTSSTSRDRRVIWGIKIHRNWEELCKDRTKQRDIAEESNDIFGQQKRTGPRNTQNVPIICPKCGCIIGSRIGMLSHVRVHKRRQWWLGSSDRGLSTTL